jgi:Xaa-Pro aminopeptidase
MYYNHRRLVKILRQNNLDALIASTKENVFYFSGFSPVTKTLNPYRGQCYTVITVNDPEIIHIIISIGEVDQVFDANVTIGEVRTFGCFYREYNNQFDLTDTEKKLLQLSNVENASSTAINALSKLLSDLCLNTSKVGIDEDGMTLTQQNQLKESCKNIKFINTSDLIRQIRWVKTPKEIESLRYSASCNEQAIQTVIKNLYVGISEHEIANCFNTALVKQGAIPMLTMIKIGRHAVGGQRRQQKNIHLNTGDLIWFDSDSIFNGYWSDIARVFAYKEMRPEYLKYNALLKGQQLAIAEIRPGMNGDQIFKLTMETVHDAGFSSYRRHHVGHGIGLEPYEQPILAKNDNTVVEENMVLSIETPYYEFGMGALHIEDPILIGKSSNIRLTSSNSELEVIA